MTILNPTEAAGLNPKNLDPTPAIDTDEASRRMACALKDLRTSFDAPLTDYRFAVLRKPFRGYRAGTPVAECHTATGQYLAVFDEFELGQGRLQPAVQATGNYRPKPILLGNPVVAFFAKEVGKMLFKSAVDYIFQDDDDTATRAEMGRMKDELKDFMVEIQYDNIENDLIGIRAWLMDTYQPQAKSFREGGRVRVAELHDGLMKRQAKLQQVSAVMVKRIKDNELKDCTYRVRSKVLLHTLVYGMRTVLMAELVGWRELLAKTDPDYNPQNLRTELREFVDLHTGKSEHYLSTLWEARRNFISDLKSGSEVYHSSGMDVPSTVSKWWGWKDEFESGNQQDSFRGSKLNDQQSYNDNSLKEADRKASEEKARQQAEKNRNNHIEDVRRIFDENVRELMQDVITSARARATSVGA
ncbi:hypothetical protein Q5H93_18775 [Hymenobacter sp. ASUV-10]|uniref:Uncharacterized protein n=1 Tax=Hymenobacter aranciens TaxID=3063996 RepID=A0ABT9BEY9_9BACT|nr:hypothetical protein [Hymenobacter sp. ASUV-10]MDO7876797.1 hypothetical protein [Hymenobacter sp. ASUV-10]